MKGKTILEKVFEEIPEEKIRYEKMNKIEKIFYKTGLHILNFRKYQWENIIPENPLTNY